MWGFGEECQLWRSSIEASKGKCRPEILQLVGEGVEAGQEVRLRDDALLGEGN